MQKSSNPNNNFINNVKKPDSNKKPDLSNNLRRVAFTLIAVVCGFALFASLSPQSTMDEVPLTDVIARANDENGNIKHIKVVGNTLEITLKDEDQPTEISTRDSSGTLYDQGLVNHCADKTGEELSSCQSKYPTIEYVEPVDYWGIILNISLTLVPIVVVIWFFSRMMRQAETMNTDSFGFGKAKAKLYGPDKN